MDKKINPDSGVTTLEVLSIEMGFLKARIKELDRQIEVAESEVERLDTKRNGLEIRLENLQRLYDPEQIDSGSWEVVRNESSN